MSFQSIRDRADHLRAIPLESVLRMAGVQPDRYDTHKWHTPEGVLSVTGAKFMDWTRGVGGGGAIDLAMHLNRFDFREAIEWLGRHFPGRVCPQPTPPPVDPPADPPAERRAGRRAGSTLKLPSPDPGKLGRVRRYLIDQRGLAATLIDPLIQSGLLYADLRANAVFLLRGQGGRTVGAELRGTTPQPWRGLAPGSRRDHGFFSIPACRQAGPIALLQSVILCESAIDAISCFALHPQHRCISTAGARANPLWLPPLLARGDMIYCGFDTDSTGETMARAMIALHPAVKRLRPSEHDWNDVLRSRI